MYAGVMDSAGPPEAVTHAHPPAPPKAAPSSDLPSVYDVGMMLVMWSPVLLPAGALGAVVGHFAGKHAVIGFLLGALSVPVGMELYWKATHR